MDTEAAEVLDAGKAGVEVFIDLALDLGQHFGMAVERLAVEPVTLGEAAGGLLQGQERAM